MIHERRQAHRRLIPVLAVLSVALLGAAMGLRPEFEAETPPRLRALARAGEPSGERVSTSQLDGLELSVWRSDGGLLLRLAPASDPLRPDVLVYWSPPGADDPGPGAFLLGTMSGDTPRSFPLPAETLGEDGELLLYSLGHHEIVERHALPGTLTSTQR